jgi:hypothetical protein
MNKELEHFLNNKYKTISINYSEFVIANTASFNDLQEGYRLNSKTGKSFVGKKRGDWKEEWYVIGFLEGDPVFVDINDNIIYTAAHGMGTWEEQKICNSLDDYKALLDALKKIAKGREYPIRFQKNPLTREELESYSTLISNRKADPDFWLLFVETFED